MLGSIFKMLGMIGLAAACGLTQATWVYQLPLIEDTARLRESEARMKTLRETAAMTLAELLDHAQSGLPVLDARVREQFEEEHLDAVTILNLHPARFQEQLDQIMPYLGQPLAIYCNSETCTLAEELYLLLEPMGFVDIRIFFPGWEAIKEAGAPVTRGGGVVR